MSEHRKTYEIQINVPVHIGGKDENWETLSSNWYSREMAEWYVAQWRQMFKCLGDPFRVREVPDQDDMLKFLPFAEEVPDNISDDLSSGKWDESA